MITLAIANAKGGTGKTSLAVHLAAGLTRQKARVLLVDADTQGNASTWLLGALPTPAGAAEALLGRFPREAAVPVPTVPGLALLGGGPTLAGADLALAGEVAGETLLRRALARQAEHFDYAVIDCPPAVGLPVVAALVAADAVLVPIPAAYLALAGLARLEETRARVVERLGASCALLGAVLMAVDARESLAAETRALLAAELGPSLYAAEVRISTAAKVLPAHQRTAWDAGADPRGAEDYAAVLAETRQRLKRLTR